jgi:hypothetical protein
MLFEKFQSNPFANAVKCESADENKFETSIVPGREIAAAATVSKVILPGDSCAFGSNKYFLLCGLGGIISCGSTHTMVIFTKWSSFLAHFPPTLVGGVHYSGHFVRPSVRTDLSTTFSTTLQEIFFVFERGHRDTLHLIFSAQSVNFWMEFLSKK